jgi:hypothetical protein
VIKKINVFISKIMITILPDLPLDITLEKALELTRQARVIKNREAQLQCVRRYKEKNRELHRQKQKEYYELHKDEINDRKKKSRAMKKSQGATLLNISRPDNFLGE